MKTRETELDILRLTALLAVIFTHASGIVTESVLEKSFMVFLTSIITWHVPVFVMISGRFFLDPLRGYSVKKICNAILRLIIAFVFWNTLYQIYFILTDVYIGLNWKGILSQALKGAYHFWYLIMLVCLYAIIPFLRKITEDKRLTEYFIFLFFIFEFLTMYGARLPALGESVGSITENTNFHFALGYSGYFILGYYLHRWPLSKKGEVALYIAGITSLLLTGAASAWMFLRGAPGKEWFSKYLMPNVIIEASAIYFFFTKRVRQHCFGKAITNAVSKMAEYSFGAYLIHVFALELAKLVPFELLPVNVAVAVLLRAILTFALSISATALIRKIPFVGKKIT